MRILEAWAAAFILNSLAVLPLMLAHPLAALYAKLLDQAAPRLRRIAIRNLEMAGFRDAEAIAGGVFQSIARQMLVFARFPAILRRGELDRWVRLEGLENYDHANAKGKGVLFFAAHFGAWELSAFAHAIRRAPFDIVVRPLDNPAIDRMVEGRRELPGNRAISKKDAARAILKSLREGRTVGILADQNTVPEEGCFVDFFGVKASANTAFARMAAKTGAAVVPAYALWEEKERKWVLRYYPEIPISGDAAADTQRLHSFLEGEIRKYPDQWLWIHRRWKTRPAGESPLY
ncbi:MAG: lysophospholipid acyltransferase family protein [Bryobacteraceae bacterium]|nr:lysophospholipid acyltransferase family protein [Bryobacteraceae bacterium]